MPIAQQVTAGVAGRWIHESGTHVEDDTSSINRKYAIIAWGIFVHIACGCLALKDQEIVLIHLVAS